MTLRLSGGKEKFKKSFGRLDIPDESAASPEVTYPSFSLRHVQAQYCVSKCEKNDKAAFAEAVRKITQFSWQELASTQRHGIGFEKIDRDCLRVSLPALLTPDVRLISFRFSGLKSMIGFRGKDNVFYVIWLDRDFSVYRH